MEADPPLTMINAQVTQTDVQSVLTDNRMQAEGATPQPGADDLQHDVEILLLGPKQL